MFNEYRPAQSELASVRQQLESELLRHLGEHQRTAQVHHESLPGEVLVERTMVDEHPAGAGTKEDTGGGGLATSGSVVLHHFTSHA